MINIIQECDIIAQKADFILRCSGKSCHMKDASENLRSWEKIIFL